MAFKNSTGEISYNKRLNKWALSLVSAQEKLSEMRESKSVKKFMRDVKISGVASLRALSFLALDNMAFRKLEELFSNLGKDEKKNNQKFNAFITRYPGIAAHLVYYLVAVMTFFGAKNIVDKSLSGTERDVSNGLFSADDTMSDIKKVPEKFSDFLPKLQSITPYQIAFIANPEDYSRTAYLILGEPSHTIGYGNRSFQNGNFVKKGDALAQGERGLQQAYDLASYHLEKGETYFILYVYCCVFDRLPKNTNQYIALNSLFYNGGAAMFEPTENSESPTAADRARNHRWRELREIYKSGDITKQQILELFEKYPIQKMGQICQKWSSGAKDTDVANAFANYLKGGKGLEQRRFAEACLYAGLIDIKDIIDCPIGGLYEFRKYMESKGIPLAQRNPRGINFDIAQDFKQWVQSPVYANYKNGKFTGYSNAFRPKTTADILPKGILADIRGKTIHFDDAKNVESFDQPLQSEMIAEQKAGFADIGQDAYDNENYKKAARLFRRAVADQPDNALYRNNLAAAYNQLGKYKNALEQVREILHRIGNGDNQYAAANYNAGVAYEGLGEYENALKNYELSAKRGNIGAGKDIDRVLQKIDSVKSKDFKRAKSDVKNKTRENILKNSRPSGKTLD